MSQALRRCSLVAVLVVSLVGDLVATANPADNGKLLGRVKGVVGYQADGGKFDAVFGRIVLPDDDYAITRENSAALVALPDSSIVALGADTRVRIGAFNNTTAGPGSTITVDNGALRFDIRRPEGGTANYRFVTVTSQIAVRGTIGLLSFVNGQTLVACLVCQADSVAVQVGSQTFSVLAGQAVTVSASGVVATSAVTNSMLNQFSSSQVSTATSSGASAATSGISGASSAAGASAAGAAGGAAAGALGSAVGSTIGAVAAAAAVGAAAASITKPGPPAATPSPLPTAVGTPIAPIQLQSKAAAPGALHR